MLSVSTLRRVVVAGVPNASAISHAVDGKQTIAMVVGHGNPLASGLPGKTPELQLPPVNNSSIHGFAPPEAK